MGDHCCMVGCTCSSYRSPAVSFHRLPRRGISEASDEWRRQLIVCIARADKGFNPDKAKICSRHFDESCFTRRHDGLGYLIMGSLPTKFMPSKLTPKSKSRKILMENPEPLKPQIKSVIKPSPRICDQEVKIVTPKPKPRTPTVEHPEPLKPWIVTVIKPSPRICDPKVKIVTPKPRTPTMENPVPSMPQFIPILKPCPGICNPALQRYAELPPAVPDLKSSTYYLHATYCDFEDRVTCTTTIRAHGCKRAIESDRQNGLCQPCTEAKVLILRKHARRTESEQKKLNKHAPLSKVSHAIIVSALKAERAKRSKLKEELARLKRDSRLAFPASHETHKSPSKHRTSIRGLRKEERAKRSKLIKKLARLKRDSRVVLPASHETRKSPSNHRVLMSGVGILMLPESTLKSIHGQASQQKASLSSIHGQASQQKSSLSSIHGQASQQKSSLS